MSLPIVRVAPLLEIIFLEALCLFPPLSLLTKLKLNCCVLESLSFEDVGMVEVVVMDCCWGVDKVVDGGGITYPKHVEKMITHFIIVHNSELQT